MFVATTVFGVAARSEMFSTDSVNSRATGASKISTGGNDVWGTSDQFTYAYSPQANDFDVRVRVDSLQYVGNAWSKAGLNIRESTNANSKMIWFYPTPTQGANGDVTLMVLPGNLAISFSGHDIRHADGRQLQRLGIQPYVKVAPTIRGITEGRDEILEAAVKYVQKNLKQK